VTALGVHGEDFTVCGTTDGGVMLCCDYCGEQLASDEASWTLAQVTALAIGHACPRRRPVEPYAGGLCPTCGATDRADRREVDTTRGRFGVRACGDEWHRRRAW